jgi:hypothetical protein
MDRGSFGAPSCKSALKPDVFLGMLVVFLVALTQPLATNDYSLLPSGCVWRYDATKSLSEW